MHEMHVGIDQSRDHVLTLPVDFRSVRRNRRSVGRRPDECDAFTGDDNVMSRQPDSPVDIQDRRTPN
ncbi:MAG: hypothetical protein ACKOJF_26475, partial [Planctomycetaceae bacterium]